MTIQLTVSVLSAVEENAVASTATQIKSISFNTAAVMKIRNRHKAYSTKKSEVYNIGYVVDSLAHVQSMGCGDQRAAI